MEQKDEYKLPFYILLIFSILLIMRPLDRIDQTKPSLELTANDDRYTILEITNTGSMKDLVRGKVANVVAIVPKMEDIYTGNFLIYETPYSNGLIAHRVVKIDGNTIYMKGDSADDYDLIGYDDVHYKIVAVVN